MQKLVGVDGYTVSSTSQLFHTLLLVMLCRLTDVIFQYYENRSHASDRYDQGDIMDIYLDTLTHFKCLLSIIPGPKLFQ